MSCPVCKASGAVPIGSYRNESAELNALEKVECQNCSLVYVDPLPSENLWKTYNENYFSRAHGGAEQAPRAQKFRAGLAKIRCAHVMKYAREHDIAVHRVLEIGAGFGEFVDAYRAVDPSVEFLVVDTDQAAVDVLVKKGSKAFDTIADVPGSVDLIVLSHVVEHTRNPVAFVGECVAQLRDGGALFIEVPCEDYRYKSIDEPHLVFFNKVALASVLTQNSMSTQKLSHQGQRHDALIKQKNKSALHQRIARVRDRLLGYLPNRHLATLTPSERSAVASFHAHIESDLPARWLRAMGIKGSHPQGKE